MYKWELLQLGYHRDEWINIVDGMQLEWRDECGLVLFVYFNNPTDAEIDQFSSNSRFEVAFKAIDCVGFFSFKFGSLPWGDCAFSPNLYLNNSITPRFEKDKFNIGIVLHIFLVDTSIGELKIRRRVILGNEFSEHFRNWCLQSLSKDVILPHYNKVVDDVYNKYPDSGSLSKDADISWLCPHIEALPSKDERDLGVPNNDSLQRG